MRIKRMKILSLIMSLVFITGISNLLSIGNAYAAASHVYEVGPGLPYTTLGSVPWSSLKPDDVVNIHYKEGGYHEIILLSNSGTKDHPITIHGVADPTTGALPTIDGQNAVTAPNTPFRADIFNQLGAVVVSRDSSTEWGYIPSYITIENLHIQNANRDNAITTAKGQSTHFLGFATGIYVEFAQHLTVRGCEINNNENGFFCNSKDGDTAELSADILIEGNYIHGNGYPGDYGVHNIYHEAKGVVIQYNNFGPLREGAEGEQIKDRSAGGVYRYNKFTMGNNHPNNGGTVIWICSADGSEGLMDKFPEYQKTYFYGNTVEGMDGAHNMDWFRYDALATGMAPRNGTFYVYNNTFVCHTGQYTFNLIQMAMNEDYTDWAAYGRSAPQDTLDFRNNILICKPNAAGTSTVNANFLVADRCNVNLGTNWISSGMNMLAVGSGSHVTLTGESSLIRSNAVPGFVNAAAGDLHLGSGSSCIDKGSAQSPDIAGTSYDVTKEYVNPCSFKTRAVSGAIDLGAFEFDGVSPSGPDTPATTTTPDNPPTDPGTSEPVTPPEPATQWANLPLTVNGASATIGFDPASWGTINADVKADGPNGSNCVRYTGFEENVYASSPALVLKNPIDISGMTASDRLNIGMDIGVVKHRQAAVIILNGDDTLQVVTPNLDNKNGFETISLDISGIKSSLGGKITSIAFASAGGNGWDGVSSLGINSISTSAGSVITPPVKVNATFPVSLYHDEDKPTFLSPSWGNIKALVSAEGLNGSNCIKYTGLNKNVYAPGPGLLYAQPLNITGMLDTDMLKINLDLGSNKKAQAIRIVFNGDESLSIVTPLLDKIKGFQTFLLDLSSIREKLGEGISSISFESAGSNGWEGVSSLWMDEISIVRP